MQLLFYSILYIFIGININKEKEQTNFFNLAKYNKFIQTF